MSTFTVVFINYFDGSLLPDGLRVNVYPVGVVPNNNNLLDSAVIGAFPSQPNAGETMFSNLSGETIYQIQFVGPNPPTGSHYMAINEDLLLTVPIFYGPGHFPQIWTLTDNQIELVAPGQLISLPVDDVTGFIVGSYVLFCGNLGVFLGVLSNIDYANEVLNIVVTELLIGNVGDIVQSGAHISEFYPGDFQGPQGNPGVNGNGSTITVAGSAGTITIPGTGNFVDVNVVNGSAFPNFTTLLVTDNVNSFTGYVSGGGTTNNLSVYVTYVPPGSLGTTLASGSFVTFSGPQGPMGLTGAQGASGMIGLTGLQGDPGPGSTYLLQQLTCQAYGTTQALHVNDVRAFPVNSYLLATDGVSSTVAGVVIGNDGNHLLEITVLSTTLNNVMVSGSTVTFSGPVGLPSIVPGPVGPVGPQGSIGLPGHGSTITLAPVRIFPIGTQIQFPVVDVQGFPPLSYVLITDGVYSMTGQVTTAQLATNILSIRINAIINGTVGLSILQNAVVTYSGPPGPPGTTNIGDFGTVLFKDNVITSPAIFYSGTGISQVTALSSMNFILPNNKVVNYRVIFEFDGNVFTNQQLNQSDVVYLGVASNSSVGASNIAGVFAGVTENLTSAPVIEYTNIVTDGMFKVGTPTSQGSNTHLKFVGTFGPNTQVDFTLVGAAVQQFSSFYVEGIMTATCYPLYS